MMKLLALLITLLSALTVGFCWTIEGSVWPHQGDENTLINLHYDVNTTYAGDARLKVCLNLYDFEKLSYDYSCDILLREINITIPGQYPNETFALSQNSWLYRFCLKLYFNGKTYSDCDKDNTFMLVNSNINQIYIQKENVLPTISVESEIKDIVNESEPFVSKVSVKNNMDYALNITVYSYAYNKTKLLSEGYSSSGWKKSWLANSREVELLPKETATLELRNRVNNSGIFDFKIRIRYGDGEYYDIKRKLVVLSKKRSNLILDPTVQLNDTLRVTVSNIGDVLGNATLIIASKNKQTIVNKLIEPRRSFEVKMRLEDIDQNVYIYLLQDGFLIDSQFFAFKGIAKTTNNTEFKITNSSNSSPISVENVISGYTALKDSDLETQKCGTETILYLIIVTISLTGFMMLIRKF